MLKYLPYVLAPIALLLCSQAFALTPSSLDPDSLSVSRQEQKALNSRLKLRSSTISINTPGPAKPPRGTRNVAFFLVRATLLGETYPPMLDQSGIKANYVTGESNFVDYYRSVSHGLLNINVDADGDKLPDVIATLQINLGIDCSQNDYFDQLEAELKRIGFDNSKYDDLVFILPSSPKFECPWAGITKPDKHKILLNRPEPGILVHEYGHSLGLDHAKNDFNFNNSIDNPLEVYFDFCSPMGYGVRGPLPSLHAAELVDLNWLGRGQVISMNRRGVLRTKLVAVERRRAGKATLLNIGEFKSGNTKFLISYRQGDLLDEDCRNSLVIQKSSSQFDEQGENDRVLVATLAVGQSWVDGRFGLRVKFKGARAGEANIRVEWDSTKNFDSDNDGKPDNIDSDDDNDGEVDNLDCAKYNPNFSTFRNSDLDSDGVPDGPWLSSLALLPENEGLQFNVCAGAKKLPAFISKIGALITQNSGNDNCPRIANPDQIDTDDDKLGDSCDCAPTDSQHGISNVRVIVDSDHDGYPDYGQRASRLHGCFYELPLGYAEYGKHLDYCPQDPAKFDVGQCECGMPDTDSDNDGVADCLDTCPNDPARSEHPACGCQVEQSDRNNDNIVDCDVPAEVELITGYLRTFSLTTRYGALSAENARSLKQFYTLTKDISESKFLTTAYAEKADVVRKKSQALARLIYKIMVQKKFTSAMHTELDRLSSDLEQAK